MPQDENASYDGYYNVSAECWGVFTEVLGVEFSNAIIFGQVHQVTVDTYAVQHAGGSHPDKSLGVHLSGLHLALESQLRPPYIARCLQQLASAVEVWPHYSPPTPEHPLTVLDVALAQSPQEHIEKVREWSAWVWNAWRGYHPDVAALVAHHLNLDL
jgi:hypothetical protein